ncbi:hypothetical protein ACTHO0_26525 [Cytobacillus praedii]
MKKKLGIILFAAALFVATSASAASISPLGCSIGTNLCEFDK